MEIPNFYFSIILEAIGIILFILLVFVVLLKRDNNNLLSYVKDLKSKVKTLTAKIKELTDGKEPVIELLEDTIDYIKIAYEDTFGHELGKSKTTIEEDNSKDHFTFILGYQNLKATLAALENSNRGDHIWDKISSQMSALIGNYRIMPETQFETIVEQETEDRITQQGGGEVAKEELQIATDKSGGSVTLVSSSSAPGNDAFINERKNEIERLKGKISSQFEEIWNLQNNLSGKVAQSSDPEMSGLSDGIDEISRQLKDAELCITMMEADIATSDEEIIALKEQLEQANKKVVAAPPSNTQLTEDIKKKDAIIARFAQESKEMMSLIDGMELNAQEQANKIIELEEKVKAS